MGEINDDAERLRAANQLASARGSDLCLNRRNRGGEWQAPCGDEGERCGRVRGIDAPRHRQVQLRLHAVDQHLVIRVGIKSSDLQPSRLCRIGERLHRWVAGMHHDHPRQLARATRCAAHCSRHELRLRGAIFIKRRMEVEMIW